MAKSSQFAKGSGAYVCRICGHRTRSTGGDGAGVGACDICFELAGEENHLSDYGTLYGAESSRAMLAALDKRSGAGTAYRLFPEVFEAVNQIAPTETLKGYAVDINTPKGMADAIAWINAMLAMAQTDVLVWGIPRSMAIYTFYIKDKTFSSEGHDRATDKVLAAAGFTRVDERKFQ